MFDKQFIEFPVYDSTSIDNTVMQTIQVRKIVRVIPAQAYVTMELDTGTQITVLLAYAEVVKKLNKGDK